MSIPASFAENDIRHSDRHGPSAFRNFVDLAMMFLNPATKRCRDGFEIRQLSGADFEELVTGHVMIKKNEPISISGHNTEKIGFADG